MANEHLTTEEMLHPVGRSKKIKAVSPAHYGHVHLTFEDDTMDVIRREELQGEPLKAGEFWPRR